MTTEMKLGNRFFPDLRVHVCCFHSRADEMVSPMERDDDNFSGGSYNGHLLRDIEEIRKALYVHKPPRKGLISPPEVRSESAGKTHLSDSNQDSIRCHSNDNLLHKDKKSLSVWSWKKPLKALARIRRQRFGICFFLHVHSIEGLPLNFDGSCLVVQWKRKGEVLSTQPSRVSDGSAEFDETLMHKCSVYGCRSGPYDAAKFEAKLFLIFASVVGAPGIDLGKHWIDLTRLLPLSLQELEGLKCSGKWTTSFKLSGMANDAALNVSFSFSVIRDTSSESRGNICASNLANATRPNHTSWTIRRVGSVPSNLDYRSSPSSEVQIHHQDFSHLNLELSKSIDFLYQKLNEGNKQTSAGIDVASELVENSESGLGIRLEDAKQLNELENIAFSVTEKGMDVCKREKAEAEETGIPCIRSSAIEIVDVSEIFGDEDATLDRETGFVNQKAFPDYRNEESSVSSRQSTFGESESVYSSQVMSEAFEFESSLALNDFLDQEYFMELKSGYKAMKASKKSLSLDDFTETVASDFLSMLETEHCSYTSGSDSEQESPRERLLREFEREAMACGSFVLDFDKIVENVESYPTAPTGSDFRDCGEDFSFPPIIPAGDDMHEGKGQLLRDRRKANLLEDLETEALMREWGLDENLFQRSQSFHSDGFGSPIELPLQNALELPPLGDGFGPCARTKDGGYLRSMHPSLFEHSKNAMNLIMQVSTPVVLPPGLGSDIIQILQSMASIGIQELSSQTITLMPLEDITGKRMQHVVSDTISKTQMFESKSVPGHSSSSPQDSFGFRKEGECVQYDELTMGSFCNHGHLSYVSLEALAPFVIEEVEALLIPGLRIQCGMPDQEAPSSLSPKSVDDASSMSELMSLSITLDEWLRLDSGIINDRDQNDEHMLKILSAYHAKSIDFKVPSNKHGLMGDKLTVAQMVLLRDPLRNNESVGASMLALIQVEKAPQSLNNSMLSESSTEEEYESGIPLCRISDVHLAGFNNEPFEEQLWGTRTRKQSGTRWLLASGLSKAEKLPSSNSKAIVKAYPRAARKVPTGDVLWSITSDIPVIRNPDIMLQNETTCRS